MTADRNDRGSAIGKAVAGCFWFVEWRGHTPAPLVEENSEIPHPPTGGIRNDREMLLEK